jgi:hypothetical protein
MLTLYIGNTNLAQLTGVKDSLTGELDDGANIVITLLDSEGVPVAPQSWPAVFYNEPGGIYDATLDADLELDLNYTYTCVVNGIGSAGQVMNIRQPAQAKIRGSSC